jgi:TrmH family RNA methyltransferase
MLSKSKLKYIKSLQIKKFRREKGEFLVEGAKSILELLQSDFNISSLVLTPEFLLKYKERLKSFKGKIIEVKEADLSGIGSFESNNTALAIVKMKENKPLFIENKEFIIVLDEIKDPGNLGTIIRIADWYGIKKIVCSKETADFYNPKVISSSMGSFTRVSLYYTDLEAYLSKEKNKVFAAGLHGHSLSGFKFPDEGILLMGNESAGINPKLLDYATYRVTIPRKGLAESLNVAVATGIICDRIFN